MRLSAEQLAAATGLTVEKAELWRGCLEEAWVTFGVSTLLRVCAFLAQAGHESDGFDVLEENLNYRVEALLSKFSRARISSEDAAALGKTAARPANKEAIANLIYGGEWGLKNLGNVEPGDGWKFRGRGLIQITGRANYAKLGEAMSCDFLAQPELVVEMHDAAMSAGWFWKSKGLNELADAGQFDAITKKVNGGYSGQDDRVRRWVLAKAALIGAVA